MNEKPEILWYRPLIDKAENGAFPAALKDRLNAAAELFLENGFPTLKDEEWRFTDPTPFRAASFSIAGETALPDLPFLQASNELRIVLVNGRAPKIPADLPEGVRLFSLAEALRSIPNRLEAELAATGDGRRHGFAALNTALMKDVVVLEIADNALLEQPIELLFLTIAEDVPIMTLPRLLILVGRSAQATLIERYVSIGRQRHWTNSVGEIIVGENASIFHIRVNEENQQSLHTGFTAVRQERSAVYSSYQITLGGRLVRNDLTSRLEGEGAESILNGLYITAGEQLVDNHTLLEHAAPHTGSRELYKGILAERSRAVFCGKIYVHKAAQKTDAVQSNKNLLLTDEATIDTQPQLEIYADDVRCTHGGTVGQLDADALFYLQSRGIAQSSAKRLLTQAFVGEVIESMPEPVKERFAVKAGEVLAALI
ncbi:MAG: Fe-S cluster assembly protein SufD [candidate division KSB1 bacterium]|nr:Fe-S cluster assembly protein SufD [candidate division KSB1 bacterium]